MLSIESIGATLNALSAKQETPLDTAIQLGFDPTTPEAASLLNDIADYFGGDGISVGIGVILGYSTALRASEQLAA